MNHFKKIVLAAVVAAAGIATSAQASLIGETITGTGKYLTPGQAVISSSTAEFAIQFTETDKKEISTTYDGIVFDFADAKLTISTPVNTGFDWDDLGAYRFSGFDTVLTSVVYSAAASHNFGSGADDFTSDFRFDAHSITFNLAGGSSQNSQSTLVFDINRPRVPVESAEVPEPTTIALLGLGLLGFAASRRPSVKSKKAQ